MLDLAAGTWEIVPWVRCSPDDDLIPVPDSATAAEFLRSCKPNFFLMLELRDVLPYAEQVSLMDDDSVIGVIAARLASGELVLRSTLPSPQQPKKEEKTGKGSGDAEKPMPVWYYSQHTGQLKFNGRLVGTGYSGTGTGKNNSALEDRPDLGPIPRGHYRIGKQHDTQRHGPGAMNLTPLGHGARGRSGFMIHGDNKRHDASTGCIVLPRNVRNEIAQSESDELEVGP